MLCHAEPLPPPFTLLRPSLTRARDPSGLRMPHSFFCTKPQPKTSPGTPDRPTPVRRRRGSFCSGEQHHPLSRPFDRRRWIKIRWRTAAQAEVKQRSTGQRLHVLQKRPRGSPKSTRSPPLFKNNSSLTLFLTRSPLVFLEIEPAVHSFCFYALDPRFIL